MKVRAEFTIVFEPDRYAVHYGQAIERVRGEITENVSASICDLPGLCNTGAGVRWHVRGKTWRSLARPRTPRAARMRVRSAFTVDVERETYARWSQVPLGRALPDLRAYLATEVPLLPCMHGYGAEVRWHRPEKPDVRRTEWPTGREWADFVPGPPAEIPDESEWEWQEWA